CGIVANSHCASRERTPKSLYLTASPPACWHASDRPAGGGIRHTEVRKGAAEMALRGGGGKRKRRQEASCYGVLGATQTMREPTGVVRSRYGPVAALYGRLPSKLACVEERESPKWKGVEELAPPRQAYSHSASVGKRYVRPFFFSSACFDSFRQKATASSQET